MIRKEAAAAGSLRSAGSVAARRSGLTARHAECWGSCCGSVARRRLPLGPCRSSAAVSLAECRVSANSVVACELRSVIVTIRNQS